MADISKGTLVRHSSLGVGKVVAVETTALHVFFPGAEKRFAAKLRWPAAKGLLETDGVERDSWLEGLTSFALDPAEGRYALATSWITHDDAIAAFLKEHPAGFADPAYLGTDGSARKARAPRWRAAIAEWNAAFGDGALARLVEAGNGKELAKRALRVEPHVVKVPGTLDAGTLAQAFADPEATLAFFAALAEALAPGAPRARLDKLFQAAVALDVEAAAAWPVATLFPFLADPAHHAFLAPRTATAAAERLGCDLRWDPAPNRATYAALRALAAQLLAKLEPSGAVDLVDVEAFLHFVASTRNAARAEAAAKKPAAKAKAGTTRAKR